MSAWTITGPRHGGITVSNLDRSLEFYCGLLGLELLQYHGCESMSGSSPPSHHGTGHFCVFVTGIEELYEELLARGVSFRSDGPVEMKTGVNAGGKSLYSLDPDGYIFEFHQRPPQ